MNYGQQRALAIAVAICLAVLGALALGNAETLGISPRVGAWLTVVSIGLGTLQGFLPNVRGTDQQPEHIANRVRELSKPERLELLKRIEPIIQEDDAA